LIVTGFLLDADWVIQAQAGYQPAARVLRRLPGPSVSISWATIAEIYEGAFNASNPSARIEVFQRFLHTYRKLALNESIVQRFAELRAFLRRRGEMLAEFDVMLAATALEYDLTVLTFNVRHLSRIPDLKLYQPSP
jgi:tRNA(fMet)-specific endonuclease VapC